MDNNLRIREIFEKIPAKWEGKFAPNSVDTLYGDVVSDLYAIISSSPDEELIELIDKLSVEKGYANGKELFAYMF